MAIITYMDEIYTVLKKFGRVKANEPLSKHTTYRIGGPARYFVIVNKERSLIELIKFVQENDLDYFTIGSGSNLLISDSGFDGVVIKIATKKIIVNETNIEAEAGAQLGEVVSVAGQNSLKGLEWGIGIPGTIGGAVRGNAGAMGSDMSKIISEIKVLRDGEIIVLQNSECGFEYRDSSIKHNSDIVLSIKIALEKGDVKEIMKTMEGYLQRRSNRIPPFPNPGSFFKNTRLENWKGDPKLLEDKFRKWGKVPTGWLIEQSGCKDMEHGGAAISDLHSNFIVNKNKATFADIIYLVEKIKEKVYNTFGVELENEVEIIN